MDLPKALKINRDDWDVCVATYPADHWGYCSSRRRTITINKELSKTQAFGTLCHELMHVFFYELGLDNDGEIAHTNIEGLCTSIGIRLARFLEDNCEWKRGAM